VLLRTPNRTFEAILSQSVRGSVSHIVVAGYGDPLNTTLKRLSTLPGATTVDSITVVVVMSWGEYEARRRELASLGTVTVPYTHDHAITAAEQAATDSARAVLSPKNIAWNALGFVGTKQSALTAVAATTPIEDVTLVASGNSLRDWLRRFLTTRRLRNLPSRPLVRLC
jgi:hypothetical protein